VGCLSDVKMKSIEMIAVYHPDQPHRTQLRPLHTTVGYGMYENGEKESTKNALLSPCCSGLISGAEIQFLPMDDCPVSLCRGKARVTHQLLCGGASALLKSHVVRPQRTHPRTVTHAAFERRARTIRILQFPILRRRRHRRYPAQVVGACALQP